MYEVEFKAELTKEEREKLITVFKEKNFPFAGMTPQNDYYIQAEKSPYGGYDLQRYRSEDGSYFYTQKIWEMIDGHPARKENEHEISKDEFESEIAKYPKALVIRKDREWFDGICQGQDISITIDSVQFDHSPGPRYFIEAEIDTEDKGKVTQTKEMIQDFLKELLGKSEVIESPGMFMMAFEKK
jgi:adenylate cyclase class IV